MKKTANKANHNCPKKRGLDSQKALACVGGVRFTMKKAILPLIVGITIIMNTYAGEEQKLIEAMLFVVAPTNEDPSGYEDVISVCRCSLAKARNLWEKEYYQEFSNNFLAYANKVESVVSSPETLIAKGMPKKEETLIQGLEKLSPYISECEQKFNTRVEY